MNISKNNLPTIHDILKKEFIGKTIDGVPVLDVEVELNVDGTGHDYFLIFNNNLEPFKVDNSRIQLEPFN
jgi:hypothetical protein